MANNSMEILIKELEKCIVLCTNCHAEIHHPDLKMKMIEKLVQEIKIFPTPKQKKTIFKCECGRERKRWARRCPECFSKFTYPTKINWPSDEELLKMLEGSSFLSVGKKLGVSDNAIRKHLKLK